MSKDFAVQFVTVPPLDYFNIVMWKLSDLRGKVWRVIPKPTEEATVHSRMLSITGEADLCIDYHAANELIEERVSALCREPVLLAPRA
jgi:hypothetical protein